MINITIEREDRLRAISDMASAIKSLAHALDNQTKVEISDITMNDITGTGISISSIDENMVENSTFIGKEDD